MHECLWQEASEDWIAERMTVTGCFKIQTDWLEHGAEPLFISWPNWSILLQQNRVTYPLGVLLSRGLGSGKKASILVNGLCAVIHRYSLVLLGRSHVHIGSTKAEGISSPQETEQTQTATPFRSANTAYITLLRCCRALSLGTVLIKRII